MFMWMWLLLLNLITGIAVPATSSAEANLSRDQALPNPTTNITAKTMTVSNQENKAIFDGSVVLTRRSIGRVFRPHGGVVPSGREWQRE